MIAPFGRKKAMSRYHNDSATDRDLLHYEDFQEALYDVITQAETPLAQGEFHARARCSL